MIANRNGTTSQSAFDDATNSTVVIAMVVSQTRGPDARYGSLTADATPR